jgi:hypothetical protein
MFDSGMVAASVGVPAELARFPKRLEDCVTWEELFLGIVAAGGGVPKRPEDCVTWEELFLGMGTDVPEEAGTGALEDCATGPT